MTDTETKIVDYLKQNPIKNTSDINIALGRNELSGRAITRNELDGLVAQGVLERRVICGYISVFLLK